MVASSLKNNSPLPVLAEDPWLEPYTNHIEERTIRFINQYKAIKNQYNSLKNYANLHHHLGFHYDPARKGFWYREWAPGADQLFLIGDFNEWNRNTHPLTKEKNGIWSIFISDNDKHLPLKHGDKVKTHVIAKNGYSDKISPYIKRVTQNNDTHDFSGQIWHKNIPYKWKYPHIDSSKAKANLTVYECHIGIAQDKLDVGSYLEFKENILPRIKDLGYNTIQIMAIQEHPYYGSFGYHVSNFFAPSSRFGSPEDLKSLIDKAHEMGITVIMDLVHSHAVKNTSEGLFEFDGTDYQYFHAGDRGHHEAWDSKLFDYGKEEVVRFLLSNIRYWMEEFHVDGFRFDGITSMLYQHHGLGVNFDHYDKYFVNGVDHDAILYLQLANQLIHEINSNAISIAEDMSGMPGLCRKNEDGGIGFDYRLGMGIPDFWIKLLKHTRDEEWDIDDIWNTLTNRRHNEKTIAYAESHDQALVGDKTLAFWLMDKEMYDHMHENSNSVIIDRGIALHKIIRFLTLTLGGEGYLNFMGNEFGHPEWVDFPREGNNWSYQYARRQWGLVDNQELNYKYLNAFDKALIQTHNNILPNKISLVNLLNMDYQNKTIIYEKGDLIFLANLEPEKSIFNYEFTVPQKGNYQIILNSDDQQYGGFSRLDNNICFPTYEKNGVLKIKIYNINRTALILKRT